MRRATMLAMALALSGCSGANPMAGRLRAGSEAVVYNDPKAPEPYDHVFADVEKGTGFHGSSHIEVPFGATVEVLEDPEGDDDAERPIRIRILEGENKDRTGKVKRWYLRALPAK